MNEKLLREKHSDIITLYEQGLFIKQIARQTNKSKQTVKLTLEKLGMYERQPVPNIRSIEERTFTCMNCGKVYISKRSRGEGDKFCTRECSDEYRVKQRDKKALERVESKKRLCDICGKEYIQHSGKFYCSDECRKEHYRRLSQKRADSKSTIMTSVCKECGKEFNYKAYKRTTEIVYCSDKCLKKACGRNAKHNRRIVIKQAKKEPISMNYLMKKYRSRCQMCDCKVHRSNGKDWSPNIATIDHIIPVSRGGTHTYDNVQLLCAMCNTRKSNNMDGVQLSLFMGAKDA